MAAWPCSNPSCKSQGQPHPNCRCPAPLSNGGEIGHFCSENRPHLADCEYFAPGGAVDFDSLTPDTAEAPQPSPPANFDSLTDDSQQSSLNFDHLQDDQDKYGTTGQQAIAGLEGATQGVLGPLAPLVETHLLGVKPEDIVGRQQANPLTHGLGEFVGIAGSLLTGTGEAALATKAAQAAAKFSGLGKVGAAVIKGAISNGLIQGGDEVSRWMLGQSDPTEAAGAALAHVGAASLLGIAGEGVGLLGGAVSQKLQTLAEAKAGRKLSSYLAGIGDAASDPGAERIAPTLGDEGATEAGLTGLNTSDYFIKGQQAFDKMLEVTTHQGTKAAAEIAGSGIGGFFGGLPGLIVGQQVGKILSKPISGVVEKLAGSAAKKYVAPVTMKILSSGNTRGLFDALNHAENVANGYESLSNGVDALFKGGTNSVIDEYGNERARQALDDYISAGGINQNIQNQAATPTLPPNLAEGGEVVAPEADSTLIAEHYPEQNITLAAAKGRISNYLQSLKPAKDLPKLAFDDAPDQRNQQRIYNSALHIANQPLGILNEIKAGTVEPEHIQHLQSMYPETNQLLQKKLTERLTRAQLDGEKPSYKVRQGLSMLMGTPLSSEMMPASMQAIQAIFQPVQSPDQPAPAKTKHSTSGLNKLGDSILTDDQARQARQQKIS